MTLSSGLALLNACLNGAAGLCLLFAWFAIRRRDVKAHRRRMITAFGFSCAFLVSYVTRFALSGNTPYLGGGVSRMVYFGVLLTHITLAIAVVPLALRTLYLGAHARFSSHRKIARVTFPIWMYVSVTGVLIYFMLYHGLLA